MKSFITWCVKYVLFFFKNIKYLFSKKDKICFLMTPLYGNIGDLGIYVSEYDYLKKINKNILEIPINYICKYPRMFKPFIKNSDIYIIGGGFLGTIWLDNEIIIRNIIMSYLDNKIVIMPQTMYYDDEKELEKSIGIYSKHNNLTIILREDRSYNFAINNFTNNKVMYLADSVLALDYRVLNNDRNGICLVLRKDNEKINNNIDIELIKSVFPNVDIVYSDMITQEHITYNNRCNIVKNKLDEFSHYKLIITDRLHGMIFSTLTNTPVIAFDNRSHKVSEVYKKININYVRLCDNNSFYDELLYMKNLINNGIIDQFDNTDIVNSYMEFIRGRK